MANFYIKSKNTKKQEIIKEAVEEEIEIEEYIELEEKLDSKSNKNKIAYRWRNN